MPGIFLCLNTIYLYIILKPSLVLHPFKLRLNTIYLYIILKHRLNHSFDNVRLNTIYLYIILKLTSVLFLSFVRLNTIYLYIILKHRRIIFQIIKRLNTIYLYIILKPGAYMVWLFPVWIPYIFTSFSNFRSPLVSSNKFEYHISLHHSQTLWCQQALSPSLNTIYLYIILKRKKAL